MDSSVCSHWWVNYRIFSNSINIFENFKEFFPNFKNSWWPLLIKVLFSSKILRFWNLNQFDEIKFSKLLHFECCQNKIVVWFMKWYPKSETLFSCWPLFLIARGFVSILPPKKRRKLIQWLKIDWDIMIILIIEIENPTYLRKIKFKI